MGVQTCGSCGGRGFTTTSQWRPNPAGGMGQNVTIRHHCNVCGGSGSIRTPDPPKPVPPPGDPRGRPGGSRRKTTIEEYFGIIAACLMGWVLYRVETSAPWYVWVGLCGGTLVGTIWTLNRSPRLTLVLSIILVCAIIFLAYRLNAPSLG